MFCGEFYLYLYRQFSSHHFIYQLCHFSSHRLVYQVCVRPVHIRLYMRCVSPYSNHLFFVKLTLVSTSYSFSLLLRFCNHNVVCFSAYSDLCYRSGHFHARSFNNFNSISWRTNLNLRIVHIFFIFLLCHFQIYARKICSETP